jgi:Fe-S-cluster containining protein
MAAYLGMSVSSFWAEHCRRVWWRVSLREREGGDCVLLGEDGCLVYPVRPAQCRAFPFWGDLIAKPAGWDELKERCPGVGRGRLYSREEIEAIMAGGSTG